MTKKQEIQLFNDRRIRTIWDDKEEKWYFSVVDVIEALTETDRPRKYWSDLKAKLKKEGSELSEKIGQLKLQSSDGKYYKTDIADQEQLFRFNRIRFLFQTPSVSYESLFRKSRTWTGSSDCSPAWRWSQHT